MSLQSKGCHRQLKEEKRGGAQRNTLSVITIKSPKMWLRLLITTSFCIKTLIYISDYIFYETVRSIRAGRELK